MRAAVTLLLSTALGCGCSRETEIEFRRVVAEEASSTPTDGEQRQKLAVTELRVGSSVEMSNETVPSQETSPSRRSDPVEQQVASSESNHQIDINSGDSSIVINGNVEVHESHFHTHFHLPPPSSDSVLNSHEMDNEPVQPEVSDDVTWRRQRLMNEMRNKQPLDPYCERMRRLHEIRVGLWNRQVQMLIGHARR